MKKDKTPGKLNLLLKRLNGDTTEYYIDKYINMAQEIESKSKHLYDITDKQLRGKCNDIREQIRRGIDSNLLIADAFSVIMEAIRRTLQITPFRVQLIAAIVLHQGKLAEMGTGEGKTLTAVFPACLNALIGKSVHILTFNDYLARRDAEWMAPVYGILGLSVGFVLEGMGIAERQEAYNCDVTYLTARESGFDYLRDSLCHMPEDRVHRPFHFVIIDEADSILIDEARVPLIIAGNSENKKEITIGIAELACRLKENEDFTFDEYHRNVNLSTDGARHVERVLGCGNLYEEKNLDLLTKLNCALHAEHLLQRNVDYIVRKGKVELVDEFTGRIADKRRWPDGLQSAIEEKEKLKIQEKGEILNSISLQFFLRKYKKISGMTATAHLSVEEFRTFYDLDIVIIPPNRKCIRIDHDDILLKSKEEKENAIVEEICSVNRTGQPILVGTRSVDESERIAEMLAKRGVKCNVLNARNDAREAEIIAMAGMPGALTISTNMAGRGTDIKLGGRDEKFRKEVAALGGLYVICTNRHESRRIDMQLRGRAGRQGDPGSTRFFISLEDDLFIRYRLKDLLNFTLDNDGKGKGMQSPRLTKEINRVQIIIEGQNLEIRKTLVKYSSFLEQQRVILSDKREQFFNDGLAERLFRKNRPAKFQEIESECDSRELLDAARKIALLIIDRKWSDYLAEINEIRESIHLRRFGGQDPILEFRKTAIELFEIIQGNLENEMVDLFDKIRIENNRAIIDSTGLKAPSSTWTYLVNDNPYENILALNLSGNIGLSTGVLLTWPLLLLLPLLKRIGKRRKLRVQEY